VRLVDYFTVVMIGFVIKETLTFYNLHNQFFPITTISLVDYSCIHCGICYTLTISQGGADNDGYHKD
jgi:hypothetical protein